MTMDHSRHLHENLLQLGVVDDGAVSPRALSKASFRVPDAAHAHAPGEKRSTVRNQLHFLEVARIQRIGSIGVLLC